VPAAGQTNDVAAATEALSRLTQFSNDVRKMREVARLPLGPYQLETSCSGPLHQFPVDFTYTRSALDGVLANIESDAGTFSKSYEPTQAWIDGLPKFSENFDATADRVLGVQTEIKAGRGPTEQQRQVVEEALKGLAADLGTSSKQLQGGTKALAIALQRQSSYGASIQQAIDGADWSAQAALDGLKFATQFVGCKGVDEKFAEIKGNFSRNIQDISTAFQKVEASSRVAQKGLAVLLGTVVTSQTDLQSVLGQVEAAKNDELGSFLERLHLTSAKRQWEDLAAAVTRLSKG
jgi:hypothetical protein